MAKLEPITSWGVPWSEDAAAFNAAASAALSAERLVVGIIHADHPHPDELLSAQGWDSPTLTQWCATGATADKLLRLVMRTGTPATDGAEGDTSLARGAGHVLCAAVAESFVHKTWWFLAVARRDPVFSPKEQHLAALMLRHWQALFSQPDEPGMGRLLLGSDNRLIAADLNTRALLLQQPNMLDGLVSRFHPVLQQRYPGLADRTTRDIALQVDGRPVWVCFRRCRAVEGTGHEHWYLEVRSLEPDELTTVGLVADPRIAQALAFIHEQYAQAPSLADISRHVHVSPFHFHRLFTRQVGISPKHYLQRKQLQVAKWLLRKGGVPIATIAVRTGFSSHGHFTSTFHRLVGVSPSEYRESH
jgi:AraC-like DNA-binding protein